MGDFFDAIPLLVDVAAVAASPRSQQVKRRRLLHIGGLRDEPAITRVPCSNISRYLGLHGFRDGHCLFVS